MPKEWTDKIKAQEEQQKQEADKIHNLPKEFNHQQEVRQQHKEQKDSDIKEPMLKAGERESPDFGTGMWNGFLK